jgi:hypothetical protein
MNKDVCGKSDDEATTLRLLSRNQTFFSSDFLTRTRVEVMMPVTGPRRIEFRI